MICPLTAFFNLDQSFQIIEFQWSFFKICDDGLDLRVEVLEPFALLQS